MTSKLQKKITTTIPYVLISLFATNLGEAIRLSEGRDASEKTLSFFTSGLEQAFASIAPSFNRFDLLIGAAVGGLLRLAVYIKGERQTLPLRRRIRHCKMGHTRRY